MIVYLFFFLQDFMFFEKTGDNGNNATING